jgi:hypothetical protein
MEVLMSYSSRFLIHKIGEHTRVELCPAYVKLALVTWFLSKGIFVCALICGTTFGSLCFMHRVILRSAAEAHSSQLAVQDELVKARQETDLLKQAITDTNKFMLTRFSSCGKSAPKIPIAGKVKITPNIGGE